MRCWVLIFSLILWEGAIQAKSPIKLLEQLDRCIFENPDSAQILFTELGKFYASLSTKQKGRFCSNKGIFYAMQGDFKQAIRNLNVAYQYTEPNSIQRSNTLKNLANVYKSNANYSKALALLSRSLKICKSKHNKDEELSILGEIAAIEYYQFNWAKAIKINKVVINGLEKRKDFRLLAIQQQRLANLYFSLERYDDAIAVYRHSMQYYDKHSSEKLNAAYIRIGLGDAYFAQGHFEQAYVLYAEAAKRLFQIDIAKYWLATSKLAQAELALGKIAQGFPRLQKSYQAALDLNLPNLDELLTYLLRYSKGLTKSKLYLNQQLELIQQRKDSGFQFNEITWSGLMNEAVKYYQLTQQFDRATSALLELRQLDKQLNADFQREKSQRLLDNEANKRTKLKAQNLELDLKYYRSLRWVWALSIFLLIALGGLYYYYAAAKAKNQKLQNLKLKLDNFDLEARLELEHKNVRLEQELQATKERELAAMSLQLFQLQESIKADILSMDKKGDSPEVRALQKKFSATLKRKDYWKEFEMKFIQLNPEFHQKLLKDHPSLTKKDLDFCSLVRLNLGNKEIASLTQIAYESVISKKYKLRKKLGFLTDNELFVYLQGL